MGVRRLVVVGVQVAGSTWDARKLTGIVQVDLHVWVLGEMEGGGRAGDATADNADAGVGGHVSCGLGVRVETSSGVTGVSRPAAAGGR